MEYDLSAIKPFLDDSGRITVFPTKHKKKLMVLWYLVQKIEGGRKYSEREINDILDEWTVFRDHAMLRRELYNKMLLNRTKDCSRYWRAEKTPSLEEFTESYV